MKLFSAAFAHNGAIPSQYTCEGRDVSPPLGWSDVPEGVKSLALVVEDPDAPDWQQTGYRGPCPPAGRHRYFHRLYALDAVLPELHRPTRGKLEAAMQRHVLAEATLVGTYQKGKRHR